VQACQRKYIEWKDRCDGCGNWNTIAGIHARRARAGHPSSSHLVGFLVRKGSRSPSRGGRRTERGYADLPPRRRDSGSLVGSKHPGLAVLCFPARLHPLPERSRLLAWPGLRRLLVSSPGDSRLPGPDAGWSFRRLREGALWDMPITAAAGVSVRTGGGTLRGTLKMICRSSSTADDFVWPRPLGQLAFERCLSESFPDRRSWCPCLFIGSETRELQPAELLAGVVARRAGVPMKRILSKSK
jgi:hypothetical protein